MRLAAALAILSLAVAQVGGVLSCACGTECADTAGSSHCPTEAAPEPGCCDEKIPEPSPAPTCGCFHGSPDVDVDLAIFSRDSVLPVLLTFPNEPSVLHEVVTPKTPPFYERPPPRRGQPIYLLVSTLLI